MRLFSSFLWLVYKLIIVYTLLVFALSYWTLSAHWLAGFLMLSLPILLIIHGFFLVFWALVSPKRVLTSLVMIGLAWPFLGRTFQFRLPASDTLPHTSTSLKVLNYNVFNFSLYNYLSGENTSNTDQIRSWISTQDADILCFQEFYSREDIPAFNFVSTLKKAGYKHYTRLDHKQGGNPSYTVGVALFSKYPIVAKRDTFFGGQNGILQADIAWGKDTVRIMNVHLFSMTLKLNKLKEQEAYDGIKRETKGTIRQMRRGFNERSQEVAILDQWQSISPYPVIICGDFNDTPYSYVYGRLAQKLTNAFEKKGHGFGFTYNRLPYFIRIDHQFYDHRRLELTDFQTLNTIPFSDHYPLTATYMLRDKGIENSQ
ncbi:endonuclease/exonuclease/phosphatase family protein [Arundinibacter roseus]|uniref:Endonuclease/exonuclease/phosphatase n=1 Tax=Arundinibacter roseus TaxID=2070510 RepID=A0A4R4KLM0_9BACT|nr:endonuclease/exonuclease/phosphatase family protein [Arundinibacter roseus]TDB67856.1 endonuclease/exonuclease/phosphatase [Arundinibacter roseus]